MKKQRTKTKGQRAKTNGNRSKLIKYNTLGYLEDMNHLCKLGRISESRRDWIENTMLQLRQSANAYEIDFAAYLMKKKIKFIHQAPFIFSGKIYFADFYLPQKRTIIEIDGNYHYGIAQSEKDKVRDQDFNGMRIKVVRLPNSAVYNEDYLKIIFASLKSK